jgi:hypothetical protein
MEYILKKLVGYIKQKTKNGFRQTTTEKFIKDIVTFKRERNLGRTFQARRLRINKLHIIHIAVRSAKHSRMLQLDLVLHSGTVARISHSKLSVS